MTLCVCVCVFVSERRFPRGNQITCPVSSWTRMFSRVRCPPFEGVLVPPTNRVLQELICTMTHVPCRGPSRVRPRIPQPFFLMRSSVFSWLPGSGDRWCVCGGGALTRRPRRRAIGAPRMHGDNVNEPIVWPSAAASRCPGRYRRGDASDTQTLFLVWMWRTSTMGNESESVA